MSERIKLARSERIKLARKGAAVGLAAIAVAGFAGKANAQPEAGSGGAEIRAVAGEQAKDPYQLAQAALNALNRGDIKGNVIANSAIVIPAGTPVEKAPMDALAYKVPAGKVLLLQRERLIPRGENLWAAVWVNTSGQVNQANDARNYQWVNLTAASKTPGFAVLNYKNYNPDTSNSYPFTFPVAIDKASPNNLMVISPSPITHFEDIAAAAVLPKADLTANLDYIGLVPAKEPVRFIKASPIPPINPSSAYKH